MNYQEQRMKQILDGRPLPEKKKPKWLKPVSDKRAAKIAAAKEVRGDDETEKQKWFSERQKEMTGTCQCGCGEKSSKQDYINYRSSICHVLPQRLFPSIEFHPLNWVERKFWAGNSSSCHTNMDNRSIDLWPNMADWDDIKEKFQILSPLLTEKERAKKFYNHLSELVAKN